MLKLISRLMVVFAFAGWAGAVSAGLIVQDYQILGDGLITYDTNTKFEWLDLTETANRSYEEVSSLLGSGDVFSGWRYANLVEAQILYQQFGFSIEEQGYSPATPEILNALAEINFYLGGLTLPSLGAEFSGSWGIIAENFTGNTDQQSVVNTYREYDLVEVDTLGNHAVWKYNAHPFVGSLLLRTHETPNPATFALFGIGLAGLGWSRRKKS